MYRVIPQPAATAQVAALPRRALTAYAEILDVLLMAPWDGSPQHEGNPAGAVRRWAFGDGGAGQIVYLVLEDRREVHLLLVQWWGSDG